MRASSSTIDYVSVLFIDGELTGDWEAVTQPFHLMLGDLETKISAGEMNLDHPVYLCTDSLGSTVKYFIDAIAQDIAGIHFLRLTHFSNPAIAYVFKQRDGDLSNYSMFPGDE